MKKQLIIAATLLAFVGAKAQQDPQFTHFMFDKLSINPGSAGANDAYCFTGIFRNQWTGFGAGEPQTVLVNAQAPVSILKGGVGLTYFNDKLGWEDNNLIRLSYSYHLKNIGPGTLGIGASVGYFQKKINPAWITPDAGAGTGPGQDASIPTSKDAEGAMDFSFGAYYYASNFYAGISATHLSQSQLKTLNVESIRHYYLMGGYTHTILNGDLDLKPNLLVKSDISSTQLDVNFNVLYKKFVWLGVTYRNQDAIAPMFGVQFTPGKAVPGTFKLGYSYDATTSDINNYSSGSHEVMLNYCFNISINKPFERSVHPRFL